MIHFGTWRSDTNTGKWHAFVTGKELPVGTRVTVERRDRSRSDVEVISTVRKLGRGFLYNTRRAPACEPVESADVFDFGTATHDRNPAGISGEVSIEELNAALGL